MADLIETLERWSHHDYMPRDKVPRYMAITKELFPWTETVVKNPTPLADDSLGMEAEFKTALGSKELEADHLILPRIT